MRIANACHGYAERLRCAWQTGVHWVELVNAYANTLAALGMAHTLIAHLEYRE